MHKACTYNNRAPSFARWFQAVAGLSLLSFASAVVAGEGRFEVIDAELRQASNDWYLDARINMELSNAAVQALESGVTMRIKFQYEITQQRRFWLDPTVLTAEMECELQYLSLTQRYALRFTDDRPQTSYATLSSALRSLGRVRDFKLPAGLPVEAGNQYAVAMRVVLDRQRLPGPLQMFAFWRGDFSLESDWYRWELN